MATEINSGSEMKDRTGDPTLKVWPRAVTESIRREIRKSFRLLQSSASFLSVMIGSEVIVAIPETTEFDLLAWAIGPVTKGTIRIAAIEPPSKVPNKIMATKVLDSIRLWEKRRMNVRASNIKEAHIALIHTGLANPTDDMTIAEANQVANARELSRKST